MMVTGVTQSELWWRNILKHSDLTVRLLDLSSNTASYWASHGSGQIVGDNN